MDQLLERYLARFDGSPNALTLYRGYVRNHISPLLGRLKVGELARSRHQAQQVVA